MKRDFSKKYVLLVITILALLNIFSWGMLWLESGRTERSVFFEERAGSRKGDFGGKMFRERLGLDTLQQKQFGALREAHFAIIKEQKMKVRKLNDSLVQAVLRYGFENKRVEILIEAIAEEKVKVEKLNMRHFGEMRELCTQGQKADFDSIVIRMIKHFGEGKGSMRHRRGENKSR